VVLSFFCTTLKSRLVSVVYYILWIGSDRLQNLIHLLNRWTGCRTLYIS
jgi:hypothetical protein